MQKGKTHLGLWVDAVWVLVGLREGTVVPDVALPRERVTHITQLALLGVLFDRVEEGRLGDFHLCVGPGN